MLNALSSGNISAQSVQAEAWQQLGRARQTGGQMTKRIPNTKPEYELPSSPKISACSPLFQPRIFFIFSPRPARCLINDAVDCRDATQVCTYE